MNLTLAAAAFCNWQLAAPVVRQLTPGTELAVAGLEHATALGLLEQQLTGEHTGAVVLYAPLHLALEQAANAGTEPSQAVALWRHNATQLVRFCKQQRGRVLLFSLADVLAAPQLFKTLCTQRWPELKVATPSVSAIEHSVAVLHRLVAQSLRSTSAELNALEQQLAALAQPLEEVACAHPTLAELNQLVASMQAGQQARTGLQHAEQQLQQQQQYIARVTDEKDTAQAALVELQQENSLLLEQLHQVQEALEESLQEQQKTKAALEQENQATQQTATKLSEQQQINVQLQGQLNQAQQALNVAQTKQKTTQSEHAQALAYAQHQREKAEQKNAQLSSQLQEQQDNVNALQQQLNALSEKQNHMAQHHDALQQENALLLEQLFCVQEELEKYLVCDQPSPEPDHAPALLAEAENSPATSGPAASLKTQLKKRAEKKKLQRKAAELAASPLFNADWYLKQYPDVAADKVFANNPALHYLKCGGFEGRNPGPNFSSQDYLNANPDVAAAGVNPLYHYLRFGQAENRPLY